jgi:hypothetical protein
MESKKEILTQLEDSKSEDEAEEETKEENKVEAQEEERMEIFDECRGVFPDSCYPDPPFLEKQVPEDHPVQESQEQQEEAGYCDICGHSTCQFLQWQDELERHVDIMYPEVTNKAKRYHMYRHMSRQLNGPLGKGKRKPLPTCLEQGIKDLFPSKDYIGFKYCPFESGPRGDRDRFLDDGSTYN